MKHSISSSVYKFGSGSLTLIGILIIFLLTDVIGGRSVEDPGVIVDKLYRPERIHLVKIKETDKGGHITTHLTSEIESAEWAIYIKSESGKVIRMECQSEIFYNKNVGESIPYTTIRGYITRRYYFYQGMTKLKENNEATNIRVSRFN